MERVIFRRAIFGGFRRADVYAYIESLEEEKEKLKLSMNDEIEKLQREIEGLREKNYYFGNNFSTSSNTVEMQKLKESLAQAEKAKLDFKRQLYQADMQKAELLKKLEETQGGGIGLNLRLAKIQNEARQIAVHQKKEAEDALAKVKASVEALMQQSKMRIAELELQLADKTSKLNEVNAKYEEVYAQLKEKEHALDELRGNVYSDKQELEYVNMKLEEKEAELLAARQELSEQKVLVKMAEEVLESRNTYPVQEVLPDVTAGVTFAETEMEDTIGLTSVSESEMKDVSDNELDDIFAMANLSLNSSEEDAQQKIIQLTKIVG